MAHSRNIALGDVADLVRGVSYRPTDLLPGGSDAIPLLRATNIGSRALDLADVLYVPPALVRESQLLQRFDVVIAMSSGSREAVGRLAQLRRDWTGCVGAFCAAIRPDPERVDPEYLGYVLQSAEFREHIESHAVGTAIMNLSRDRLFGFSLQLPTIEDQRAIAHILGTLDDKIELNRRMSETLEAMARALFKSWFVDFEPVRAKVAGRDPGLPKPLADIFPGSFQDSPLGDIPKGWEVAPMADHFEAVRGVSYKGSGLGEVGMPLHNLNSIYEGGGYKHEGIKYYAGEHADRHVVKPGDVIVANTEQGHDRLLIGYAAIVPALFGARGIASHHIYRLRPRPRSWLTAAFLCRLLNSPKMHDLVSGYANGTTVNMLPIDGVEKPVIVCPPRQLVAAFDSLVETAEHRREVMVSECRNLAAVRDTLLPELMSGAIRAKAGTEAVETH